MKKLYLSRGQFTMLDDADFSRVAGAKWFALKSGRTYYAARNAPGENGKLILMHRFLMDPPEGITVDHRDGDGLNNQRFNLRYATQHQQTMNQAKRAGTTSVYRGVYWHTQSGTWRAQIRPSGHCIHLGNHSTQEAAALAYDAAAREYFGEFARLNFPAGL